MKFFKQNWNFDWKNEFESDSLVYKLIIEQNYDVIQGLISLKYKEGFVFVELIENADFNIGRNKVYYGVAGNLFAFAHVKNHGIKGFMDMSLSIRNPI